MFILLKIFRLFYTIFIQSRRFYGGGIFAYILNLTAASLAILVFVSVVSVVSVAVIAFVICIVVVFYFVTFPDNIIIVVIMLMYNIVFVYNIMLMVDYMAMSDNLLGSAAIISLRNHGFKIIRFTTAFAVIRSSVITYVMTHIYYLP